jgi:nucleotide-binding universal stress UspA family protein
VHAIDPAGYAFPRGVPESLAQDQSALHLLEQIERETQEQGIQIHSTVETEVVYERILQTAHDHNADLIVLDTRAVSRIGRTTGNGCPTLAGICSVTHSYSYGSTGSGFELRVEWSLEACARCD